MRLLENRWLTLLARLVLGGFFIYASFHKILDPPDFAKTIHNYKLVPGELVHLAALFLPWFELFAGLALVSGLAVRGGAAALLLLALVFIAALSFNLYRGHPTICGCFSTHAEGLKMTTEDKFQAMWREIFIDIGLTFLALQILYATRGGKRR